MWRSGPPVRAGRLLGPGGPPRVAGVGACAVLPVGAARAVLPGRGGAPTRGSFGRGALSAAPRAVIVVSPCPSRAAYAVVPAVIPRVVTALCSCAMGDGADKHRGKPESEQIRQQYRQAGRGTSTCCWVIPSPGQIRRSSGATQKGPFGPFRFLRPATDLKVLQPSRGSPHGCQAGTSDDDASRASNKYTHVVRGRSWFRSCCTATRSPRLDLNRFTA